MLTKEAIKKWVKKRLKKSVSLVGWKLSGRCAPGSLSGVNPGFCTAKSSSLSQVPAGPTSSPSGNSSAPPLPWPRPRPRARPRPLPRTPPRAPWPPRPLCPAPRPRPRPLPRPRPRARPRPRPLPALPRPLRASSPPSSSSESSPSLLLSVWYSPSSMDVSFEALWSSSMLSSSDEDMSDSSELSNSSTEEKLSSLPLKIKPKAASASIPYTVTQCRSATTTAASSTFAKRFSQRTWLTTTQFLSHFIVLILRPFIWHQERHWIPRHCGACRVDVIDRRRSINDCLEGKGLNVFVGLYHHCTQKRPEKKDFITNRTFRPHGLPLRKPVRAKRPVCNKIFFSPVFSGCIDEYSAFLIEGAHWEQDKNTTTKYWMSDPEHTLCGSEATHWFSKVNSTDIGRRFPAPGQLDRHINR